MSSKLRFQVAPAVTGTVAPPIPKAREWAATYNSSSPSQPLLDLSQGVPGDPPEPSVLEALGKSSSNPETARYGPILGEPSLREALAEEFNVKYNLSTSRGSGSSSIRRSGLSADDSVKPLWIPCDPGEGFKPSIEAAREYLERSRRSSTGSTGADGAGEAGSIIPRMIVLVTPNNPTGAVYTPEELKQWYGLAKEYDIALVLDETYRDFVDDSPHALFEEEDWRSTLVSLGSFSKGYKIPGHRLGSIIASPELLRHIATICDCMQICPPRAPQLALTPLLPSLRPSLHSTSLALQSRHKLFARTISSIPGWEVISQGGFYAYVSFPLEYKTASSALGLKRKLLRSEDIARVLALRCGVLTIPGGFFTPEGDELEGLTGPGSERLKEDRWLRFAIANVNDEAVRQLAPRLQQMNDIMGMGGIDED